MTTHINKVKLHRSTFRVCCERFRRLTFIKHGTEVSQKTEQQQKDCVPQNIFTEVIHSFNILSSSYIYKENQSVGFTSAHLPPPLPHLYPPDLLLWKVVLNANGRSMKENILFVSSSSPSSPSMFLRLCSCLQAQGYLSFYLNTENTNQQSARVCSGFVVKKKKTEIKLLWSWEKLGVDAARASGKWNKSKGVIGEQTN